MSNYRRIALWIAVLLVPGGILLLPLLIADIRKRKNAEKAVVEVSDNGPKTPDDGPGSRPHAPGDGASPPLAA